MRTFLASLILSLLALSGTALGQASALTPAQAAWLKAETRKAEDSFVKAVAEIAAVRRSLVERALPAADRITDPAARVIASLEASGQTLSEEQKARIRTANTERQQRLRQASAEARRH